MKKNYGDEFVVKARRDYWKSKYNSLQTGMYVEETLILFERKRLDDLGITMMIPYSLFPMNELEKKSKYPMEKRPEIIWTDTNGEISLTLSILKQNVNEAELPQLRDDLGNAILSVYPHYIFQDKGQLWNNINFYWTDFLAPVMGGMIYHVLYVSLWDNGILLGGFNCPAKIQRAWKRIILQMIPTIEREVAE